VNEDGSEFDKVRFKGKNSPNNMGYFKSMLGMTSWKKYNLFLFGLYRTEFLKSVIDQYPEGVSGHDMLFMLLVVMATPVSYVDEGLFVKTVRTVPVQFRRSNEPFNQMLDQKLSEYKILAALCNTILESNIPFSRKMYLPIAFLRYWSILMRGRLLTGLRLLLRRNLNRSAYSLFKELRSQVFK
jgi:hypothetical protein